MVALSSAERSQSDVLQKPVALSFSSSGLLLPYHLGVVEAILNHSPPLTVSEVHGVSGGAIAGAVAILGRESLEKVRNLLKTRIRPTWAEISDPAVLIPRFVQEHDMFPPDAFKKLSGRLHLYTTMSNGRPHIKSTFSSNEELLAWLQASCSFAEKGVSIDGVPHWDGGCCGCWMAESRNLPTISSSPIWVENASICPKHARLGFKWHCFHVDVSSLRAVWDLCFMFSPKKMKWYWQQGKSDAEVFLSESSASSESR